MSYSSDLLRARAMGVITAQFHDSNLTSETISHQLGVSRRTLDRAFAGYSSVSRFLLEVRLLAAAHLLSQPCRISIREVAFSSGFNDLVTFRTHFVTAFGQPPSTYLRSVALGAKWLARSPEQVGFDAWPSVV